MGAALEKTKKEKGPTLFLALRVETSLVNVKVWSDPSHRMPSPSLKFLGSSSFFPQLPQTCPSPALGHCATFAQLSSSSFLSALPAPPASSCPSLPGQAEGSLKIHTLACLCIASSLSVVSQEVQILTFELLSREGHVPPCPSLSRLLFLHTLPHPCPSQASLLEPPGIS